MIDENSKQPIGLQAGALSSQGKLDGKRVTVVYTMYHHLGDFAVIGGLLKKFDLLEVEFESLVAHRHSPHISSFEGNSKDRFFNIATIGGFLGLIAKLRRQKQQGRLIFGDPHGSGIPSGFFLLLDFKKTGRPDLHR
jgi:hypothetical protein